MKKIKKYITENDLMSDAEADIRLVIFIAVSMTILILVAAWAKSNGFY